MAVKIIKKENGEVVTKSSSQVRKEKLIAKAKKYIFVSLAVTMLMSCAVPALPIQSNNTFLMRRLSLIMDGVLPLFQNCRIF